MYKVASTSLLFSAFNHGWGPITPDQARQYLDYYLIAFVRHPLTRCVSHYRDGQRGMTFQAYVERVLEDAFDNNPRCLPHDGRARDYRSGQSAEEILRRLGWRVEIIESVGLEEGIRAARLLFPRLYVDQERAGELLNRLARYRRRVSQQTGEGAPVHDEHSHGADMIRYLALVADRLSNDDGPAIEDPYRAFRGYA